MNIVVCDDLPDKQVDFVEAIARVSPLGATTTRLSGSRLKKELNALLQAAGSILDGKSLPKDLGSSAFDDADIVVLDNNLAHLGIEGARLTAEAIAGYVRAFSSAKYIVSVNKNPDVDFDLRYLVGDYATRTDLALNINHLSNAGLWTHRPEDAVGGFLPWYWPKLLCIGQKRREQIAFIDAKLSRGVCETFGITSRYFQFLSRQARSLLSQAEEVKESDNSDDDLAGLHATFLDVFLASSRSLPNREERERLIAHMNEDEVGSRTIIARVVAADIEFWLRRDVLGPQEVLVDVPHLLMRMPFVLGQDVSDLKQWNATVSLCNGAAPYGLDRTLFEDYLKDAMFEFGLWSANPCFWWPELKDSGPLNAFFSSSGPEWIDAVFCEDRSQFQLKSNDDDTPGVSEFVAQFEGSWNRRFVANMADVKYVPRARFAQ